MAPAFSVVAARNATIRVVQLAEGDETSRRVGVPGVLGDVGFLDVERSSDRYSPSVPRVGTSGRVFGADYSIRWSLWKQSTHFSTSATWRLT